jgi:hypothetical protein
MRGEVTVLGLYSGVRQGVILRIADIFVQTWQMEFGTGPSWSRQAEASQQATPRAHELRPRFSTQGSERGHHAGSAGKSTFGPISALCSIIQLVSELGSTASASNG